jgi:hypothetical protein
LPHNPVRRPPPHLIGQHAVESGDLLAAVLYEPRQVSGGS